jgi:hypothetical protein
LVHQQGPFSLGRQGRREVDGNGGLAAAAFLINYCNRSHCKWLPNIILEIDGLIIIDKSLFSMLISLFMIIG